jgi:Bacterial Ig domain
MKLLLPAAILLFTSLGCSKDKDTENPVVTISTPTLGQVFNNGDPIQITGTATDDKIIHELYVRLTHALTGAVIIEFDANPDIASTSFNYQVSASSGIHYRLQVIAKDKTKKDGRKTIEFTCN